jgi:hypothetical protein
VELQPALVRGAGSIEFTLTMPRATPGARDLKLEKEVAEARAKEKAATQRVAAASARALVLEEHVVAIQQSQSLGYFVAERSGSDDYRRHLGLISMPGVTT